MNILILGATGFIGSQIALDLCREGHRVTGVGRAIARAQARMTGMIWQKADLNDLTTESAWEKLLENQDIVINCAGALQDGLNDNLANIQARAQIALQQAAKAAGIKLIVQVSADTGGAAAKTKFLKTKREADEALAASGVSYVILRPSLVVGRNAFGGTGLVRALAAMPGLLLLTHAKSQVATVTLEDVSHAASLAINGKIPSGSDIALASSGNVGLEELIRQHRQWLGLKPAPAIRLPAILAKPVSWIADVLGLLGWRSPLRTTAMKVMRDGITVQQGADSADSPNISFETIESFLARHPAGIQDLWFARFYLLKPLIFAVLSGFWITSGIMPLFSVPQTAQHLLPAFGEIGAISVTLVTCLIDIALGLLLLYRPRARLALLGMLAVTMAYIVSSIIIEPSIWLDPLGPMVKTIPSLALTLAALAILDER